MPERLRRIAALAPLLSREGASWGDWAGGDRTAEGRLTMSFVAYAPEAEAVRATLACEMQALDWRAWARGSEGRRLLGGPCAVEGADDTQLARLIVAILRGDRFSEGLFLAKLRDGTILVIARRAEALAAG